MVELNQLRSLSARAGADPLLVQAAGGNTSLKDGGIMWIKASGTWLKDATARDLFVPLDHGAILQALAAQDPACETCRAFYPVVKSIVNASFGQVRLVVRYAPLHQGSDQAIKILEAARLQGKYWQALEKTLADQPRWAAHHNPQPQLIWDSIADIGLDMAKAKADAGSPAIAQVLQQDVADMNALKVTRTPGFFVNGTPLRDFGEAQLKTLVAQEIAKARTP